MSCVEGNAIAHLVVSLATKRGTVYLDLLHPDATDDGRAFELLNIERQGITPAQLAELQQRYELSDRTLLALLGINQRTLQRRRQLDSPLSPGDSANFLEIARVLAFVSSVFGEPEKAVRWLRRPNRALNGEVPLDLLATSTGRGMVRDVVGRIAHGVFA